MARRIFRPVAAAALAPVPFLDGRRRPTAGYPVLAEGLDSKTFVQLKCLRNVVHTHNTRKITFQLPVSSSTWAANGPISNIIVGVPAEDAEDKQKQVAKPYNPLSVTEQGCFTILVKKYENAKVGGQLHRMKVGDSIAVKGGWQQWTFEKGKYTQYGMVAGGTGITPLIQAASYILEQDQHAKVALLSANKTPQDVLLHEEVAALEKAYPGRLTVHHHVDSAAGSQITQDLLKKVLPAAAPGVLIMVCGPMAMLKAVAGPKAPDFTQGELNGFLKEIGYSQVHVFKV